jgi:hypothetical protein
MPAHPPTGAGFMRAFLAVAVVAILSTAALHARALAEDDVLQQAINYVFAGRIDPEKAPEIVDRQSCTVVMPDAKYRRYIRYYLTRFNFDSADISKKYSGYRTLYELDVRGDDILLEYLDMDKTTVTAGYKSAQISLPGDIDQTRRALALISQRCKREKPKAPF